MKSNHQDWSKVELTEETRSYNGGYIATLHFVQILLGTTSLNIVRQPIKATQMLNGQNMRLPPYAISFYTCKLFWQFSYLFSSFWLFARRSSRAGVVGLLSWIIFDMNRVGGQEVS
jgi:hypothetical protein